MILIPTFTSLDKINEQAFKPVPLCATLHILRNSLTSWKLISMKNGSITWKAVYYWRCEKSHLNQWNHWCYYNIHAETEPHDSYRVTFSIWECFILQCNFCYQDILTTVYEHCRYTHVWQNLCRCWISQKNCSAKEPFELALQAHLHRFVEISKNTEVANNIVEKGNRNSFNISTYGVPAYTLSC